MINISQFINGIRQPRLVVRSLNRQYFYRQSGTNYNISGIDIFKEDWDNLLLLDACRYDLFESINFSYGNLEKKESRGADTVEFLRGNFNGKTLHDTVYVTASPMLYRHREEIEVEFHDIIDIWNSGGWDKEKKTVLPETLSDAAREASSRYPRKRLLVHYLQPHYPFVGAEDQPFQAEDAFVNQGEKGAWIKAALGQIEVNRDEVWNAYRNNLRYVLNSIADLIEDLEGKTVVTSDHGNLIGERAFPIPINEWGHPRGLHVTKLITVPWLVIESQERRDVIRETPETASQTDADKSTVKRRLAQLGYIDAD